MQTNITSNLSLFLNSLLRRYRILSVVIFIFLFNVLNAQTIISGFEKISFAKGTVIYIDSTGLASNAEEVALNKTKDGNNLAASNRKKLAINSQLNKKAKSQTKQDLPKKIEFTYHPQEESDSSFSAASKHQIIASNPTSQGSVIRIIEEAKYQSLQILWDKRKTFEKENFFAQHTISYKSSRAPPLG